MSVTRIPPNSADSERAVLGSILRDSQVLDLVTAIIRADDFYHSQNRMIFVAMLAITERRQPVDLVTVAGELSERKQFDDVGRSAYLGELFDASPSPAKVETYARVVREKAMLRGIIHTTMKATVDAWQSRAPASELIAEIETSLNGIGDIGGGSVETMQDVKARTIQHIDDMLSGRIPRGIETGLIDLDQLICGFHGGEVIVVAARPGVGKSQMMVNLVRHASMVNRVPGFIATLEMKAEEHMVRFLCTEARVDSKKIRRGKAFVGEHEILALMDASDRYDNCPVLFCQTAGLTTSQFCGQVQRHVRTHNVGYAMLDYLGLLNPDDRSPPRTEQVAEQMKRIKRLAMDANIPVFVLCQLNRLAAEDRPQLHHLRESGEIEQSADVVMFLYRPPEHENPGGRKLEIIVGKQRSGSTGTVSVLFDRPTGRIENEAIE